MKERVANIGIEKVFRPRKRTQQETAGHGGRAKSRIRLLHEPTKQSHAAASPAEEHGKPGSPSRRERIATVFEIHQVAHDDTGPVTGELGIDVGRTASAARVIV